MPNPNESALRATARAVVIECQAAANCGDGFTERRTAVERILAERLQPLLTTADLAVLRLTSTGPEGLQERLRAQLAQWKGE